MTITDTANKFRYEGNGATDTFAFSGKAFTANDLIVEIITRATDALVETLTITTDYSVTIATNGTASIEVTNATKIPTALQDIQIRRSLAQTQSVALPSGTVFPASSVEGAIDRAVGLVQDLDEIVARSVKVPVTSSVTNITLPPLPEDDKVIAWDGVLGAMKNSDTTLSDIESTATDAAASASAAASSASAAATSASNASTSADEAAASAASINLPSLTATDTGSLLQVNAGGTGYDLLGAGTSGKFLRSNGADAALSFEDLPSVIELPIGTIIDFGGTSLQTNYLATDGAAISRTTYAALFTAIGTTWGVGDGSTTFNVPNMARRTTVGSGGSGTGTLGNAVGNTGGAETHSLSSSENGNHAHLLASTTGATSSAEITSPSQIIAINSAEASDDSYRLMASNGGSANAATSSSSGSGTAHNNMQPSAVVFKQIRYQ
jgi:microcystin-dependent protein